MQTTETQTPITRDDLAGPGYVSPYVAAAAARAGYKAPLPDAIADQSYFVIWTKWPDEIRLMTVEAPMIQTVKEALEQVKQHDRAVLIFRHDPDVPRRDVSEDIARAWLAEWIDGGNSPEDDEVPAFIGRHLSHQECVAMFSEGYPTLEAAQ